MMNEMCQHIHSFFFQKLKNEGPLQLSKRKACAFSRVSELRVTQPCTGVHVLTDLCLHNFVLPQVKGLHTVSQAALPGPWLLKGH